MHHIYLSRRNLLTLLSKLDRQKDGQKTTVTIVKNDTVHPKYPATVVTIVTAVEDDDYYYERRPGRVHPRDEP